MAGVVGRDSGQVRLEVLHHSTREELEPFVLQATQAGAAVNTDEWNAYGHLPENDRPHVTVCHKPGQRQWARDDDGDGVREVHNNTIEGFWTGLRNFLRLFRGVHKKYLDQYTAIYEWSYNAKTATINFFRLILGPITPNAP